MQFVDHEFRLSHGKRTSPVTQERLAHMLAAQEARTEFVARRKARRPRRTVRARVVAPVRAALGGGRHRA